MVILTNVYEFNQVPIYTNQMKGVLFFLLLVILSLAAPWSQNFYQKGQEVEIKVRKLFSKQNLPQDFYSLPFCRPKKRTMSSQSLGEIFFGDRIDSSPFVRVNMLEQISCRRIDKFVDTGCTIPEEQGCTRVEMECPTVAHDDIAKFIKMIRDNYEAQLIVDSLPVANIQKVMNHTVGDHPDTHSKDHSHVYLKPDGFPIGCSNSAKTEYYINNHLTFHIKYYQDKRYPEQYYVVGVGVIPASIKHTINSCREDQPLSANLKKLVLDPEEEDMKIPFSYSIEWEESDIQYASRWDSYLYVQDPKEMRIHWLSIFNSFAVVLFLSGAIAMILLRILRKDIAAYNDEEDMDNQTGWKVLHGDIFRKPTFSTLFSITVGSGAQVFGMFFITLVLSVGFLSPSNRGSVVTLMVVFYAFIGFFGGYTSLRMYRFFGGESWKWVSFFTAAFFPGMIFAVFMLVNSIIWLTTTSTISLPVLAVAQMVAIWIFCSLPLVMLGGYFGFHIGEGITVPVKVTMIARTVPSKPWYLHGIVVCLLGGILPFGAVFIELYFVMSSIWLQKFYQLFGILLVVFVILMITSSEITILITYFSIANYDYNWWWSSLFISGSSAIYLYAYSIFYFVTKVKAVSNVAMNIVYYGYMLIISLSFFMLTSVIGFYSAFYFLRTIYASIKVD